MIRPRHGRARLRARREGIALLVVILMTMVVAAVAAGAALIGANSFLISHYDQRLSLLVSVADAGLEEGRATLNAIAALFPDTGYIALEEHATVYDGAGEAIPGVTRSTYAGPVGGGPGQFGNFGTIITIAEDADGAQVIRRRDLIQESFAKYAYFTDNEGTGIAFNNADVLYGPVHSNDDIEVRSSGATFFDEVTTPGTIIGKEYGTFHSGYTEGADSLTMPSSTQLASLQSRASVADLAFTATPGGDTGESTMRIEFVAADIDGDGENEGFIKVYEATGSAGPPWVTASAPSNAADIYWYRSVNCGHFKDGNWVSADSSFRETYANTGSFYTAQYEGYHELRKAHSRCFLGGADSLRWKDYQVTLADTLGAWRTYPDHTPAAIIASGRPDSTYLFPLDRDLNPYYRGVIYVNGKVVVSGVVRGNVTLAATGNIIIGDDITYDTDPSTGTCNDLLGLWAGDSVVVANNTLNTPQVGANDGTFRTYDDTGSEFIQAVVLATQKFQVEEAWMGSTDAEPCDGASWGRGCLYLTGGVIQQTRGVVSYGTYGYLKRYSYDECASETPPPYFPSTGHFFRSRYYEVDPSGFDVATYFRALN